MLLASDRFARATFHGNSSADGFERGSSPALEEINIVELAELERELEGGL